MPQDHPARTSGYGSTTIHIDPHNDGKVFLLESGAIGMEYNGRVAVHSIERWLAYSWNDLTNTHQRNFPAEAATLNLGAGDAAISLRGHPYER